MNARGYDSTEHPEKVSSKRASNFMIHLPKSRTRRLLAGPELAVMVLIKLKR